MSTVSRLNTDQWVDLHGDALFQFAVARVGDREVAEDLVQETFLAALRSLDKFQGKSSEKTWLFAILKRKIVDHFRKNKLKTSGQEISCDPEGVEKLFNAKGGWEIRPGHWDENPGKAQEDREFIEHFYRCLSDLPKRNADAFVHREIEGLSTGEICEKLDITENNCWVMLYRARMMLRRCLELAGFGPADGENQ